MEAAEKLAQVRREQPTTFWVWKAVVSVAALLRVRGASELRKIADQASRWHG